MSWTGIFKTRKNQKPIDTNNNFSKRDKVTKVIIYSIWTQNKCTLHLFCWT